MRRMPRLLTGWSDFFMTIGEALLPEVGLHRVARHIVERHYTGGRHRLGAKEIALARIYEKAGDLTRAEEYLTQAAEMRPDYYVHLGQFLARIGRPAAAIEVFEQSLGLEQHPTMLEFIQKRIAELRQSQSGTHP